METDTSKKRSSGRLVVAYFRAKEDAKVYAKCLVTATVERGQGDYRGWWVVWIQNN